MPLPLDDPRVSDAIERITGHTVDVTTRDLTKVAAAYAGQPLIIDDPRTTPLEVEQADPAPARWPTVTAGSEHHQ